MASPALAALAGGALRLTVFIHLGVDRWEAGETNPPVEGKVYTFYGKLEDSHLAGKNQTKPSLFRRYILIKDGFDFQVLLYVS